jgi:threonine efflux protein
MIDILPFLKIAPVFALGLVSPGPDFMLVSTLALSRGRMAGVQGAAGIATGILLYVGLSLLGLGVLFGQIAAWMIAVKIMGGLYLCWLGLQLWRSTFQTDKMAPAAA